MNTDRARLIEAGRIGDLDVIDTLIDCCNYGDLEAVVLEAIEHGQLGVVECFAARFKNLFYRSAFARAAMTCAAKRGHLSVAKFIGAILYPDTIDKEDQNDIIYAAARYGHSDVVSYLLNELHYTISVSSLISIVNNAYDNMDRSMIECMINHVDKQIDNLARLNATFKAKKDKLVNPI
jgi:hypothetical protein